MTYKNIDYEWLTRPTGDPFVDAGGYALETLSNKFPDKDIIELISIATDIYVDRWDAKINAFFLNSKITHNKSNNEAKKANTKLYFENLIKEREDASGCNGFCRVTGRHTMVFPSGRENSVLTGSHTFINFHHGFQSALMLSKEVIIRYFFLPLACEQLQGRIALISSNSPIIMKFFSQSVCEENLNAIANNSSQGILKARSNNPCTSLFRYADKIIYTYKDEFDNGNDSLTLYHFTNFGASPDLEIYQLPFQVLRFYSFVQKAKYKDSWNNFVRRHYHLIGARYDGKNYVLNQNRKIIEIEEDTFQYWRNTVYNNLLGGISLSPLFLKYIRDYPMDFIIIKTYEIKIRNMKKETIEKIEQLADFIIKSSKDEKVANVITKLDGITSSYLLRRFVIKDIVEKNYKEGNKEAIVTVDDYTNYLFPDTDSWKETRDVLVIAIYERLHQQRKEIPTVENTQNLNI